jgi:hypothetical protein
LAGLPNRKGSGKLKETRQISRHTEFKKFGKSRDKARKVKGIGNEVDVTELPLLQQIHLMNFSLKRAHKAYRSIINKIAKCPPNSEEIAFLYGKEKRLADVISDKRKRLKRLDERYSAYEKAQKTIKANEEIARVEQKKRTDALVARIKAGEAQAPVTVPKPITEFKREGRTGMQLKPVGKKMFAEQPRQERRDTVVIIEKAPRLIKLPNGKVLKKRVHVKVPLYEK